MKTKVKTKVLSRHMLRRTARISLRHFKGLPSGALYELGIEPTSVIVLKREPHWRFKYAVVAETPAEG